MDPGDGLYLVGTEGWQLQRLIDSQVDVEPVLNF